MRRPIEAVFSEAVSLMGGSEPEDSTEESGLTIPIQRAEEFAGSFHVFMAWEERCKAFTRCVWGCSLKSVE